ncbi:hypothetical protein TRIUR3_13808 [Triticum urartu]|uniref:Dual specificity protein phosphatase 12 n=1 Tax=Triticum urartu TaxID=4572 RepID=M7ZG01_TRIUA|nr:hypothetical protein TRIUR3_13808 [Triticum urartu]
MEANQPQGFGVEQKSGPEQTDEMLGSQVNQKFTGMSLDDAAVEAGIFQEKQDDPEARLEVHQKFAEMCLDTAMGTDINQEKQSDQEARSEADQKPAETIRQCTVVESNVKSEEQQAAANPGVIYRCKKCRRMVATQEYVVTHEVGLGEAGFLKRRNDADEKKPECSACIFVEPMKWMQAGEFLNLTFVCFLPPFSVQRIFLMQKPDVLVYPVTFAVEEGYVSNKLWCMGCKTRLGSFDWAGMQCCCGAWVIPAFQLLKSRIDESHM